MLDKTRPETLHELFQESVKELDRVTRKAQLIGKIERKSRESKNASSEEAVEIMNDIMALREQIRLLDKEGL
jgi:hypothetical protein